MPESPGRIPAAAKGLALVSLFNDFASEMVYPLLPAFILRLGGGAVALGLLDGLSELTAAVLRWWSGRQSDRPGWRKPLIVAGYCLAILIRPVIAVSSAVFQVIGFRVIDRVGKGLRSPPRDALLAAVTSPTLQGRAFGLNRAADHAGAVIGSLVAWFALRNSVDVRTVIGWSVAPGLVALVVLTVALRSGTSGDIRAATPGAPPPSPASDAAGRAFWAPVLLLASLTVFRLPEALLLLRLQDHGVAAAMIPLLWAALHVVRSVSSYPGGWLTDRFGSRPMLVLGALCFALVAYGMGRQLKMGQAAVVFLGFGLVAGLSESAERTLVAKLAPIQTGKAFGSYQGVVGVLALPAGLGFGLLYRSLGPSVALTASGLGVLLAAVGCLRLKSEQHD